jgi:Ca2+-binding EF-hand superfamily protein
MLQEKIQQFTSQDSDRFRQILCMFKTQVQRSKDHENSDSVVMGVTKRQFNTVLMWLGLFATKQQAEDLFEKYDMNGDGILTVHEFLTRARPTDYPGRIVNNGEKYSFRTGKRMFLKESLNRKPVRPATPCEEVFHVSEHIIADRIRKKMGNAPGVSTHYNETPLALNDLMKIFAFYDPHRTGAVGYKQLKRSFENINMSMGQSHLELLMDKFNKDGLFDYPRFCCFVYPGKPANAVMPEHLSLNIRKKGFVQSNIPLDFSQPNFTGTYANTFANSARSQLSQRNSNRSKPSTPSLLKPLVRTLTPAASVTNLGIPSSRSNRSGRRPMSRSASVGQFRANATQP